MDNPEWCIKRKYRVNLEVAVKQDKLKEEFAYIPVRCEEIDWESFLPDKEKKVDVNSLVVVRHDPDTGKAVIFDEEAEGEKRFIIPHRFDPDHKPFALSFDSDRGDLTWLAPFLPKKQYYSIYFDLEKKEKKIPEYNGLIGDGDIFTKKNGRLSVHGNSRPVLYGDKLFGKKGIVIGSSSKMGIYFFEEVDSTGSTPNFINRGRLKDSKGNIIYGIPAFHDLDKNGLLDLVVGQNDGTLHLYKNIGSNEKPVFTCPEPLRGIDGYPLDLKKYLQGKDIIIQFADGTVSDRYPKMPIIMTHGGKTHIYTTPKFVDWTGNGRYDLLVGASGFLLHFEYTKSGYKEGVFLKDERGEIIRCEPMNAFPAVFDWNGNGKLDILVGSSHGFLYYLQNAGMNDGVPVFRNKGKIKIEKETGRSFPLVTDFHNRLCLLVGNSHGEVKRYTKLDTAETGEPILDDGEYIRMDNAWIGQNMPVARYVDMDRDGKKDLLTGDIRGGIFFYKNLGTNRNPIFSKRYQLNDEDGPIKIEGGPDPIEVDDGYSKPVTADITGDGKPDILVGTGLGRIYFYRNLGLDKEGIPYFERGNVLKDSEGNEIGCHHMSAVEAADWDGDGILDLIVGGQKDVHALKSDDPDRESQLRWYPGLGRDKKGFLKFAPYIPLEAEGDKEIQYRPVPPIVGNWEGEKVLHIGAGMIFRQIDKNAPQKIEFLRNFPPRLIRAKERFTGAYPTFSSLGKNDPLIVHGSCVSSIFAFRRSFVLNRGYLGASFKATSIQKADGLMQESLNLVAPTKEYTIPFIREIPKAGLKINSDFWQKIPAHIDFSDEDGNNVPAEHKIELKIVYNHDSLLLRAKFNEPIIERLICNVDHNNGPITTDDHISVLIDPDIKSDTYYCWLVNPLGCYKELNIERTTGETIGPWRVGSKERVDIQTQRDKKSYSLQMCIPFKKLGITPKEKGSWHFDIRRRRNLYANEIHAREQVLSGLFLWSGDKTGWVKLWF